MFTQRIYIWLSNIFVPLSRLETGVPGVSRLGLCMAGVELLPLFDWKTSASLGPVYCTFALLGSTRLQGTIGGQAAHNWAAYNLVSSWILLTPSSQEGPAAYRQSYSLIEQDRRRSISRNGNLPVRGNTWDVCKYSVGCRGLNVVWNSENISHFTLSRLTLTLTLWGDFEMLQVDQFQVESSSSTEKQIY